MNEKDRIKSLAVKFRKAILKTPIDKLPITCKFFPRGACGDASLLLATHLTNSGYGKFVYVTGRRNGQQHTWLEKNGLIIDITADQFGEVIEEVIVTTDRTFHDKFEIENRHEGNLNKYKNDRHAYESLTNSLSIIEKNI